MAIAALERSGAGLGYRLSRLLRVLNRFPVIPMFLLGLVVVEGIFANLIAPHDPTDGSLRAQLAPCLGGAANRPKTGGGSP